MRTTRPLRSLSLALRTVAATLRIADTFRVAYRFNDSRPTIVYSYWFDVACYAAALAFRGTSSKVVTRAHGFDVYADRRPFGYMPLKWQFWNLISNVFAISLSGAQYLSETYGIPERRIAVSRLGVNRAPRRIPQESVASVFHLLSISFLVPVKRIDKVIDALAYLAMSRPEIQIRWTHFGDGPLRDELRSRAIASFSSFTNLSWSFAGQLSNQDLIARLESEPYDVLVNASESEGVPVSIMEAMARGIPAVAPRVGGIPEQIEDGVTGKLLPTDFDSTVLGDALADIRFFRDNQVRAACVKRWETNYSAEKNYGEFIRRLIG